ncbi:YncE family protein [Streptomyces sp. MB09-01]|uniref:YncE family protein n=1 Tax=Streptomyces sp. MB09-01 TaxID=3028666 RepID=UPI0029C9FCDB|nr:YncE family protein [Streptomyces sp. MB09-01]
MNRCARGTPTALAALAATLLLGACTQAGTSAASASSPFSDSSASSETPSPAPSAASPLPANAPTPQGLLLTVDFGSGTVTFVDPERGAVASVAVGRAPYGLAVGADGLAWAATAEGLAVVDTRTRARVARIPYRTDAGPATDGEYRGGGMGIALSPDGAHAYVGVNVPGTTGVLEVVDTATRRVTAVVPVGRRPFDVDVSADGAEVYVTGHDSFDVTVVDASLRPRRIEVAAYGTEGGLGSWLKPHYTAVRPADGKLLLPFEGERLAVVDPRTGRTTVEPMTADTHQHGATVTADGRLLVVGTGAVEPGTGKGPSLTVRSPDGSERVYPLEGPHEDVAVSRDGRTAYVTGGYTRDGHWNGITVVDLETGAARRLPAGARPLGVAVL